MPTHINLADARAKLERSKRRADQLLADSSAWLAENGEELRAPVVGTWDQFAEQFVFEGRNFSKPAPADWALELGDIVTALRSALDYAAWELVRAGDATLTDVSARDIQFPIVLGPDKKGNPGSFVLDRELKRRLPGVPSKFLEVVSAAQPFHAGDNAMSHGMAALVEMSNRDKHRTLHVLIAGEFGLFIPEDPRDVVTVTQDAEVGIGDNIGYNLTAIFGPNLEMQGAIHRIHGRVIGPNPYVEAQFQPWLNLIVDTEQREPLEQVLPRAVHVVTEILEHLELASSES